LLSNIEKIELLMSFEQ